MLVSIVITNYNYGAYLQQSISSALNQTHRPIEIIVIDDGSTDHSAEIIESFGDRIRPILKNNTGHISNINLGFERSLGDAVIFLDADDMLVESAAALHAARLADPAVVKSCGYLEVIDTEGRPTGRRIPRRLSPSGDYRERTLQGGIGVYRSSHTSGNAWSRRFLEKVMPLPASAPIDNWVGPDGYLAAIDVLFGRVESIPGIVGRYRVHGRNHGPVCFRFDAEYLRRRIACRRHRIDYAERVATALGLSIDPRVFRRFNAWKLTLMNETLALMEERRPTETFTGFVTSPFHQHHGNPVKPLTLSLLFALTRILPRDQALQLAHRLLAHRDSGN